MISIVDLHAEDLEMMGTAIAMSNCRSRVTRDSGAAGDGAAGMLFTSLGIMVRPDK
jgi:hypothetical protein